MHQILDYMSSYDLFPADVVFKICYFSSIPWPYIHFCVGPGFKHRILQTKSGKKCKCIIFGSHCTLKLPSMHLQTTLSPIQFACNPLLEHSKTPSMHYQYTPHILQSILKNAPKNTLNTLQAHSKHISNTPEKHFKHTSNTL